MSGSLRVATRTEREAEPIPASALIGMREQARDARAHWQAPPCGGPSGQGSNLAGPELRSDRAKIPVVSAPANAAVLDVKDRHAADRPPPVGRRKSVELADMGAAHPPLEQTLPALFERSNGLNLEIREGLQETGCPVADSRMTSIDDLKRDVLVLTVIREDLGEAVNIVPRPCIGPLLT